MRREDRRRPRSGYLAALGLFIAAATLLGGCAGAGVAGSIAREDELGTNYPSIGTIADGTYTGTGTAIPPLGTIAVYRKVAVAVSVSGGSILSITVIKPAELERNGLFIPLESAVIAGGRLDVDVVSGASYSSIAYLRAVRKAISQ